MKIIKILSLFLILYLTFSSSLFTQEKEKEQEAFDKAREAYEKAKKSIYQKDWQQAVDSLKQIIEEQRTSQYLAESLYWIGYSMNKLGNKLENMEKQVEAKEKAIEYLNQLVEHHGRSAWAHDAKILRIEIAEELIKRGYPDFRKYINGSLKSQVGLEALKSLEALNALKGVEGLPKELAEVEELKALEAKEKDPELEIKLVALDALMTMEEEKAFPILVKLIKENENPRLRERAIFVLSRSTRPEATALLIELATRDPNSKVREQAIFWLGNKKTDEALNAILKILDETSDPKMKQMLILSLFQFKDERSWKSWSKSPKAIRTTEPRNRHCSGSDSEKTRIRCPSSSRSTIKPKVQNSKII